MSKIQEDINNLKPNLVFHKVELKSMKDIMKLMGMDKMKCSRNGIKKDGESCRFNNKCTYPNCLK